MEKKPHDYFVIHDLFQGISVGTSLCYTCGSEAVEESNIKFTATLLSTN